ncbi:YhgE/Pip domain-containing protein [Streptomyces sp. NPDC086023]|uniref:YhgE/Pip domain-containing protein n=1 Tax=Streptomyces sp. NPDC086023 TaxID=3365746 RepID=UPI0037CF972C
MASTHRRAERVPLGTLLSPSLWAVPAGLVTVLALLLSLIYMGGILDPRGSMKDLPIGLVSEDRGVPGSGEALGTGIAEAIRTADPDRHVAWKPLDLASARRQLASDKLYGVLVIPQDFTAKVQALGGPGPASARPRIDVLTNPGAGSLGSSLASTAMQQAAHHASTRLGATLLAGHAGAGAGAAGPAARLLLADPVDVSVSVGHPIGTRSGLGLSAFYYALLLVLIGFLCAGIVSNGTDIGLGYAASDFGPLRTHRPLVAISRRQTFLVNSVFTVALSLVTSSILMAVTVGFLDMDAGHLPLLWVFSVCVSAAVGVGAQALTSVLGALGQPVAMLVFIALALPSSGGTVPVQAVPRAYRLLAEFEPMRQVTDGVRAILYFGARADAGLTRAWVMTGAGLVTAVVLGVLVTSVYDRRGLHRLARGDG